MRAVLALCVVLLFLFLAGQRRMSGEEVTVVSDRDNTLYESPTGNRSNGAGTGFFVGLTGQPTNPVRRGLVRFDLEGLVPDGALIASVTLQLGVTMTNVPEKQVRIHRCLSDWGEAGSVAPMGGGGGAPPQPEDATWIHTFYSTLYWDTPGGDFESSPSASRLVGNVGTYVWGPTPEIIADVESWIANPVENYGWIVFGEELGAISAKRFGTREETNPQFRPYLTIVYTMDDPFARGDCNGDGALDIGDPIFALDVLFTSAGPASCVDACDSNDDGFFDIADAVYTLTHLFAGGTPPPPPGGGCGPDPTVDDLDCGSYVSCP